MKTYSLFASVCFSISVASYADSLPPLNLDTGRVTVSGLSSGGYMATQFHLAHSEFVSGAGIIAAGPYNCAQGDISTALAQCVNKTSDSLNLAAINEVASEYALQGKIAPLNNLRDDKVWLFHGTLDNRVTAEVSDLLFSQYKGWTQEENIVYVSDMAIDHVFPTLSSGGACDASESPFIGLCNYDAAGEMLNHLLGELTPPDDALEGRVYSINQYHIAGTNASTMAEEGYVFVPKACEGDNVCELHVSFHGCSQYADAVDMAYVTQTGINRWADDNQIVVLYPQTKKSLFMPLNPQGCWDWWGYTSDEYATKNGDQIKAVNAMIGALNANTTEANND